jgi:MFS family permease
LPSLAVSWGIVTLGVGFTTSWTQLIACRILLGVLESGFYPGCIFLLSCWYCRFQVQKRFSGFYLLALLASGFSNILAWALSLMDGVGGLAGWRWIFIMQGIITVCLGLMGYIFVVDFPDRSTQPQPITRRPFLTAEEAGIIKARIDRDRGDAVVDSLNLSKVMHHLRDWKLWEWAWLYLLNNVVTYSFSFFLPIILSGDMGYSTTMAQILSFPPYVAAAPWMLSTAWFADRYRKRGVVLILNASAAIVGIAMTGFIRSNPAARYAGVFLGVCGCNSNVPTLLSYMHNNIVGQTKRSVASALIIGGGAIGGIIASNIFRQADAPEYTPAMIAAILTQAVTVLHVGKNFWVYGRANRRADEGVVVVEGQRGFRYTL